MRGWQLPGMTARNTDGEGEDEVALQRDAADSASHVAGPRCAHAGIPGCHQGQHLRRLPPQSCEGCASQELCPESILVLLRKPTLLTGGVAPIFGSFAGQSEAVSKLQCILAKLYSTVQPKGFSAPSL